MALDQQALEAAWRALPAELRGIMDGTSLRRAITAYIASLGDGWQPIETAPKDKTPVIIAVPNKEQTSHIVGEAYFDPENSEGGDWWWAGTGWGDYHGGPIREINYHPPTHWCPLPTPPGEKK